MTRTMAVHVRFKSCYISLPSTTKQQYEMTRFFIVWTLRHKTVSFSLLIINEFLKPIVSDHPQLIYLAVANKSVFL